MNRPKYSLQHLVVCLIAFLGLAPAFAQQLPASQIQSLTPDRILAQPALNGELLRQLHWNNSGTRLAWLQTAASPVPTPSKTTRPPAIEIWSLDTAAAHSAVLISSAQITAALGTPTPAGHGNDDEHPTVPPHVTDYAWSPDSRALLLITPVSLLWFDLESGHARSLVTASEELSDAQLSPDGRYASFIRDHSLWLTTIATGATRRFTPSGSSNLLEGEPDWPYRNDLGLHSAYWWAPDSSRIAYLETDDHATGKYQLRSADGSERSIVYPLPGTPLPVVRLFIQPVSGGPRHTVDVDSAKPGYLPRVCWTPDSHQLAFERLSRDQ